MFADTGIYRHLRLPQPASAQQNSGTLGFTTVYSYLCDIMKPIRPNPMLPVDDTLVITNWHIGEYIVEFEQGGKTRATYGNGLLRSLSRRLTLQLGKGYSRSNLQNMRRLYLYYPKCQTVSGKLSWSHWCELLEIDDSLERQFYENICTSDILQTKSRSLMTINPSESYYVIQKMNLS